jgi:hypothetical protein
MIAIAQAITGKNHDNHTKPDYHGQHNHLGWMMSTKTKKTTTAMLQIPKKHPTSHNQAEDNTGYNALHSTSGTYY